MTSDRGDRSVPAGGARYLAVFLLACAVGVTATRAPAQLPERLHSIIVSTDVDIDRGMAISSRDDCLIGYFQSPVFEDDLCFASFAATDVDGAHVRGSRVLLSFDTTTPLSGGEIAHPADVVIIGSQDFIFFDHRQFGVPDAANVDAVTEVNNGGQGNDNDVLLSFDATIVIDYMGTQLTVSDEDLVRYRGDGGPLTLFFDGSAHGVPEALDLDAAGTVPGAAGPIAFEDEDVLLYNPASDSWELLWDVSTFDADLARADVDAIANADVTALTPTPTATGTVTQTAANTAQPTATATVTRTASATFTATAGSPATATATAATPTSPAATTTATAPTTATVTRTAAATLTATATAATPSTATATPVTPTTPVATATATATSDAPTTPTRTPGIACVGDCDQDGTIVISELILAVNVALGNTTSDQCPSADADHDGAVEINELIQAVNNTLSSCS